MVSNFVSFCKDFTCPIKTTECRVAQIEELECCGNQQTCTNYGCLCDEPGLGKQCEDTNRIQYCCPDEHECDLSSPLGPDILPKCIEPKDVRKDGWQEVQYVQGFLEFYHRLPSFFEV